MLRRQREEGTPECLVAFVMEEKAIPRGGMRIEEGGEVTSGGFSPMLEQGIGLAYVASELAAPGTRAHDRPPRPSEERASRVETHLLQEGLATMAEEYPGDLAYHPEHDWARIEGDEATLGITWHAQDALGELVHYEPPAVGAKIGKDESYGEIESVKAVSDVISPLSGEVLEVNQAVVDAPETVNEDPYGNGWLVRIRLADPGEADVLLDADAYRALVESS